MVIDHDTRWPAAWAFTKNAVKDITWFIGLEIISCFGKPKYLFIDGGPDTVSNSLKSYFSRNYVNLIVATCTTPRSMVGSKVLTDP